MTFDGWGEGIGDGAPMFCLIRRALGDAASACFQIEGQGRADDPGARLVQTFLLIGCAVGVAVTLYMMWRSRRARSYERSIARKIRL